MKYENNEIGLNMFVSAMKITLEKHESEKEDSWTSCDIQYLTDLLADEFNEYINADNHDKKASELVDIANVCMMLYHRHIEKRNYEEDLKKNRPHTMNMFFSREYLQE